MELCVIVNCDMCFAVICAYLSDLKIICHDSYFESEVVSLNAFRNQIEHMGCLIKIFRTIWKVLLKTDSV